MKAPARFISPLLLLAALVLPLAAARAQIQVEVHLRRHSFIPYEPVEVILSITNFAGRDVLFENVGDRQWLDLQVTASGSEGERELTPIQPDLNLNSLVLSAGQTIKRSLDIGPHYALRDSGGYRVRASVFLPEANRYFSSNFATFDLTEGHTIWKQTVGVPLGTAGGGPGLRTLSLLIHRLPDRQLLYARVRDDQEGVTFTTQSLGRLLTSGAEPVVTLDGANRMHVLHLAAPRTYLYTEIGLNGERLTQKVYTSEARQHPTLAKRADGAVVVANAELQARSAEAVAAGNPSNAQPATQPRLGDRPAGLPKPVR